MPSKRKKQNPKRKQKQSEEQKQPEEQKQSDDEQKQSASKPIEGKEEEKKDEQKIDESEAETDMSAVKAALAVANQSALVKADKKKMDVATILCFCV